MSTNGRRFGSSITLEGILGALDEARHRLRHRLIMLAAYGPGYGRESDEAKISMPPWTEDPAVPLETAKPSAERPRGRRHHAA